MTGGRPLARLVITLALLILGAVALLRLPLDYLPRQSFPELTVGLNLGDASDPAAVTREWVEEIEGAIRSLGRVEEVGGEVRTDGARTTLHYDPHHVALVGVRDALENRTLATIDYHLVAADSITDINDNVTEVRCDPLGQVRVAGELWQARADEGAETGADVRVESVGPDLVLSVRPVASGT